MVKPIFVIASAVSKKGQLLQTWSKVTQIKSSRSVQPKTLTHSTAVASSPHLEFLKFGLEKRNAKALPTNLLSS